MPIVTLTRSSPSARIDLSPPGRGKHPLSLDAIGPSRILARPPKGSCSMALRRRHLGAPFLTGARRRFVGSCERPTKFGARRDGGEGQGRGGRGRGNPDLAGRGRRAGACTFLAL